MKHPCSIEALSDYVWLDSEIFQESESGELELIGVLSEERTIELAYELLEIHIGECEEGEISSSLEEMLSISKLLYWYRSEGELFDEFLVTVDKFSDITIFLENSFEKEENAYNYSEHYIFMAIKEITHNSVRKRERLNDICNNLIYSYRYKRNNNNVMNKISDEKIRQGNTIINFLKSDKSLFLR
jgi:hypothetical protein